MRDFPPVSLPRGTQRLTWDGGARRTGTRAYAGTYVAHLSVASAVGTSDLRVPFDFAD